MGKKTASDVAQLFWEQKMGTMVVKVDPVSDKKSAHWSRNLTERQTKWLMGTARSEERVATHHGHDKTDGSFVSRGHTYHWSCATFGASGASLLKVQVELPDQSK